MDAVFLKILNMSMAASWLVLAVLALRFLLKKAPKWSHCLLWSLVAVRLVCPFSMESALSLLPSSEVLPEKVVSGPSFRVNTGLPVIDRPVNDYLGDRYFEGVTVPANSGIQWMTVLSVVWLLGMAAMAVYALVSYRRLCRRVAPSIVLTGGILLCDYIDTPFILGLLKPKIYLPSAIAPDAAVHVLAHEKAHLERRDHWWKPLGFALLSLHWFNPIMWLAYVLLCRDIELACDEKVIREMGAVDKKAYSEALLSCSVPRYMIAACPLAFGEVGVKERVKTVLNYKKPTFWIIVVAVIACAVTAVCFLTDPKSEEDSPFGSRYRVEEVVYQSPAISFTLTEENFPAMEITSDGTLKLREGEEWMTPGIFEKIELTEDNFDSLFMVTGSDAARLRAENRRAWEIYASNSEIPATGTFYYLLQQENGDIYLTIGTSRGGSGVSIGNLLKLAARADSGFTMLDLTNAQASDINIIKVKGQADERQLAETAADATIREILAFLGDVQLSPEPVSQSLSEDRPRDYAITLRQDKSDVVYYIDLNCSEVWVDDGVKPSYSYTILEPDLFEAWLEEMMGVEINIVTKAETFPESFQEWLLDPLASISYGTLVYLDDGIVPGCDFQEPEELQRLAELLKSIETDQIWEGTDDTTEYYFAAGLWTDFQEDGVTPHIMLHYNGEQVLIWYRNAEGMLTFITDEKALCSYMQSLYEADRREYNLYRAPMEEPMTYSYGYANISVPQWSFFEYEIVEYTDDSTSFGIRLRPVEEEGWLYVSYWPNGFGVCGTGLTERPLGDDIEGRNHSYTAGYYDGSEDWSFAGVNGTAGSYVLQNEGASEWIERCPAYLNEILRSSRFGQGVLNQPEVQAILDEKEISYDDCRMRFDYQTGCWTVTIYAQGEAQGALVIDLEGNIVAMT